MSDPACKEDHDHTRAWFCVYANGDSVMRPAAMQRDFRDLVEAVKELTEVMRFRP